jgi:hypothetical protein
VTCVLGDPAAGTFTTVADAQCNAVAKPATSQACNPQLCLEAPLLFAAPLAGSLFTANEIVNISWSGGMGYGAVRLEVRQVATGVAGAVISDAATLEALPWLGSEVGLPTNAENVGWALWTVPASMSSGHYNLRALSASASDNNDTVVGTIAVRNIVQYELVLLPQSTAAGIGSATSVKVCCEGGSGERRRWGPATLTCNPDLQP